MMESHKNIRRAVYPLVAVDIAFLLLFVAVGMSQQVNIVVLAAICLPVLLIFNFVFLRRRFKSAGPSSAVDDTHRQGGFSLYACSAIFAMGTLYGVLMIAQGDIPRTIFPVLLVPIFLAVYCLKLARKTGRRKLS